jgi:integrase/recombinase XerD
MLLKEAIEQFLFHCRYEKNLSPKTLKAYSIDLRQTQDFLVSNLESTHLEAIDKAALRLYIKNLFNGLATKSVKRKVASLKALFNFLEREDLIAVNPFRKMDVRIKETKRLPRALSLSDLKRLFHHLYQAKNSLISTTRVYRALVRDIAVLETLFATGARVAEVCHLKAADVDLDQSRLRILGKGGRERLLQLPDHGTRAALVDYKALWLTNSESANPYFFHNRLGQRLTEQSARSMLSRHATDAGLTRHLTPHMLRHSVATLLLEQGVDIRYIQHFLGHSSITTTQIYTALHDNALMRIISFQHPRMLL